MFNSLDTLASNHKFSSSCWSFLVSSLVGRRSGLDKSVIHNAVSSSPSPLIGTFRLFFAQSSFKVSWVNSLSKSSWSWQSTSSLCFVLFEFFHNSRLIRWIQPKEILIKIRDLSRNWTQITCSTVRHFNHYTILFSVLMWDCNWILVMHGWSCPICLIHLIGQKSVPNTRIVNK